MGDGSCIVWDITQYLRINAMFANTNFSAILYHPDESQYLTTGTDRKVTYWDSFDASAIRVIDGSDSGQTGAVNAVKIPPDGRQVISVGAEGAVMIWNVT